MKKKSHLYLYYIFVYEILLNLLKYFIGLENENYPLNFLKLI